MQCIIMLLFSKNGELIFFFFKLRNQIKSEDMKEILWKYRRAVYFISYFISFDLSGDVEQNHIEFAN